MSNFEEALAPRLSGRVVMATTLTILDMKCEVMANWLYKQQIKRLWTRGMPGEGVVLKKARENYACSPETLHRETGGLFDQVVAMNVNVWMPPHIHLGVC